VLAGGGGQWGYWRPDDTSAGVVHGWGDWVLQQQEHAAAGQLCGLSQS
jgi:hypothetical protein